MKIVILQEESVNNLQFFKERFAQDSISIMSDKPFDGFEFIKTQEQDNSNFDADIVIVCCNTESNSNYLDIYNKYKIEDIASDLTEKLDAMCFLDKSLELFELIEKFSTPFVFCYGNASEYFVNLYNSQHKKQIYGLAGCYATDEVTFGSVGKLWVNDNDSHSNTTKIDYFDVSYYNKVDNSEINQIVNIVNAINNGETIKEYLLVTNNNVVVDLTPNCMVVCCCEIAPKGIKVPQKNKLSLIKNSLSLVDIGSKMIFLDLLLKKDLDILDMVIALDKMISKTMSIDVIKLFAKDIKQVLMNNGYIKVFSRSVL